MPFYQELASHATFRHHLAGFVADCVRAITGRFCNHVAVGACTLYIWSETWQFYVVVPPVGF